MSFKCKRRDVQTMTERELEQARVNHLDKNVGFDYTIRIQTTPEFTEVVSSMGGDVRTHRIYGSCEEDFNITCK